MSASALIQVNILCVHKQALSMHIYNKVCPVLFASPQKHQWTCTYMSAFVPSTLQIMHGYMSIVNTMPRRQQPQCVHTCQHWIHHRVYIDNNLYV